MKALILVTYLAASSLSAEQLNDLLFEGVHKRDKNLVATALAKGANPNALAMDKLTIFTAACAKADADYPLEIIDLLIRAGANLDANSSSPIKLAVMNGNMQLLKKLLKAGAKPNAKFTGGTLLNFTRNKGLTEASKLLKQAGAK